MASDKEENENLEEVEEMIESSENNGIFPGYENVKLFTEAGFKVMTEGIKSSNKLPSGKLRDYYESYPRFQEIMKEEGGKVLSMLSMLMKHVGSRSNIHRRDDGEKLEMIVDANDVILERVDTKLDEIAGIRKNPVIDLVAKPTHVAVSGSWNRNKNLTSAYSPSSVFTSNNKVLTKPQLDFRDKINNNSNEPFEPRIKYKPHSRKPLAILLEEDEDGLCQYSHPYEFELERFQAPASQTCNTEVTNYKPLEQTPLCYVNDTVSLDSMLNDLKQHKEIAIDLEHHSYRSYQGITCLMQLSTRETDYIVDTLSLRHELHVLNEIFTDPACVKVLHGADSDIQWLQRDLCLYIVNMFDTHQAARLLNYPRLSLAYLLSRHCNVRAQKQYQLADWRIRPLPEELVNYAREDTHYLLYIYDIMKNELISAGNNQNNLLLSVVQASTLIAMKRYVKPVYRDDGYLYIYNKSKKLFDNRQQYALKNLYKWRDETAREQDESIGYVLPNHMMLHIAETLPREMQGILACCNPVPVLVRLYLSKLHEIVLRAREQPLIKPVFEETQNYRPTMEQNLNFELSLRCPHDLTYSAEFREDLPSLLSSSPQCNLENIASTFAASKSNVCVFNKQPEVSSDTQAMVRCLHMKSRRLTPYQRYKLVKPYTETLPEVSRMSAKQVDEVQNKTAVVKEEPQVEVAVVVKQEEKAQCVTLAEENRKEVKNKRKSNCGEDKEAGEGDGRNVGLAKKEESKVGSKDLVLNPYCVKIRNVDRDNHEVSGSKRKKNKREEFQPFDYTKINFDKFHSGNRRNSNARTNERQRKKQKSKCYRNNNKSLSFNKT